VTIVAGLPKGAVPEPAPVLEERWSLGRAYAATPATLGGTAVLGLAAIGGVIALVWGRGRDRRFRGSQVDQVMGNPTGEHQAVPLGEADESAPVEFAPPDDMRPGQMGPSWTAGERARRVAHPRRPPVRYLLIRRSPRRWFGNTTASDPSGGPTTTCSRTRGFS
jgi:hypothetical protein